MAMRRQFFLPFAILPLTACASAASGDYPSLAARPIETRFAVVESVPVPPPGPLPAVLAGQMAQWRERGLAADRAFGTALPGTEQLVTAAVGAPVASEVWVQAQQALSRLATMRGPTSDALADVDALYIARSKEAAFDGMPDIAELRAALSDLTARQDARLAALAARLAE
jgi:hypothetical protein